MEEDCEIPPSETILWFQSLDENEAWENWDWGVCPKTRILRSCIRFCEWSSLKKIFGVWCMSVRLIIRKELAHAFEQLTKMRINFETETVKRYSAQLLTKYMFDD